MNKFIKQVNRIAELIQMEGQPVCIQYCDNRENDKYEKYEEKEQLLCQSIQDARFGEKIRITAENNKCRGGSYFVGLLPYNKNLLHFWTNIEMSHLNRSACVNFIEELKPVPCNVGDAITLTPVKECKEIPDLVLFVCRPDSLARLLGLYNFAFGKVAKFLSYTAACSAAIGVPMGKNDIHVSFIDNSARYLAEFQEDELMVTIPFAQIEGIYNAIALCIWGEADAPYKNIEKKMKGAWTLTKELRGEDYGSRDN